MKSKQVLPPAEPKESKKEGVKTRQQKIAEETGPEKSHTVKINRTHLSVKCKLIFPVTLQEHKLAPIHS